MRVATGAAVIEPGTDRLTVPLDFAPTALVLWWGATEPDGVRAGNGGGLGFCAGRQAAVAWASADAVAPTQTARRAAESGVLGIDAAGGVILRGEPALEAGGFAVDWSSTARSPWTLHYVAVGGSDVEAAAGSLESPRVTGRAAVNGLGSEPDLVLLAPTGPESFDQAQRGLCAAVGAAAGRRQAGASYVSRDGAVEAEVGGAQRGGAALVTAADLGGLAALARLEGGALDWETVWPTPRRVPYLALRGMKARVGTARGPTEPGSRKVRVGFRPEGVLLFTWGLSHRPGPADIGRLCIGAATPDAQGCLSWDDRDTQEPATATHVRSSTREGLVVTNTQTSGIHAAASVSSFDRRGFTLDWTASDGHEREFVWVALGG